MAETAEGTFEVEFRALNDDESLAASGIARISLEKRYAGGLDGRAHGLMLAARGGQANSAVYVAIERVTGTLDGRRGSFTLHHRGVMDRGAQSLEIAVVPDSGTDELEGLAGGLAITVEGALHRYTLSYTLPDRG